MRGGFLVAGVGPGGRYLCGLVQVAALGQQLGQLPGGVPVVVVGPGAQPVQVAALSQQHGQLGGGVLGADRSEPGSSNRVCG